jgi:hypothetical protein
MSVQAAHLEVSLDTSYTYSTVAGAGDENREGRKLEHLAELEAHDSISMSPQGTHGISTTSPISLHRQALRVKRSDQWGRSGGLRGRQHRRTTSSPLTVTCVSIWVEPVGCGVLKKKPTNFKKQGMKKPAVRLSWLDEGVEKEAKEVPRSKERKNIVKPAVHPKWDVQKYPRTVSIHRSMYAYIYWAWGSSRSMHPWFVTVRVFVLIIMTV